MELLNKVKDYLTKERRYHFADESKWTGETLGIVYDAVYATEMVISESKSSQWISVEDGLPEQGRHVLISVANKEGNFEGVVSAAMQDGSWVDLWHEAPIFDLTGYESSYFATHWMPLPSPPQAQRTI